MKKMKFTVCSSCLFVQCRRKLSCFDLSLTLVVSEDEAKGFVKVNEIALFSSKICINAL